MFDQYAMVQKKLEILKSGLVDDECNLQNMQKKQSRQKQYAVGCFILTGLVVGLALLFPKLGEVSRENPMFEWIMASQALIEVTRIFLYIVAAVGALLGLRFLYQSFHGLDQVNGMFGSFRAIEKQVQERIRREKEDIRKIQAELSEAKRQKDEKQKKQLERAKAAPAPDVAQADLSGVTKTKDGDLFMNMDDVWKELEEDSEDGNT